MANIVKKYCVKTVVTIEAIVYDGNNKVAVQHFMGRYLDEDSMLNRLKIPTLIFQKKKRK